MKKYESPNINEETMQLIDVIAVSNQGTAGEGDGNSSSLEDLFPKP
jgi:hypothetical protein